MAKPKTVLKGTAAMYRITQAPTFFTPREARAEYARLRAVAQKRIQRLQSAGYKIQGPTSFKPLPRGASEADIYKSLADVARFISQKSSTISGRKEAIRKMVKKMQSHKYDFINERNAEEFGEFMKEAKKHDEYRGYDSAEVVDLFHIAKQKRVKPEELAQDLDIWIKNEKLYNMKRSKSTIGSEELRAKLNMPTAEEAAQKAKSAHKAKSKSKSKNRIRGQRVKQPKSGIRPRR